MTKTDTIAWARERNAHLQLKGDAAIRVANALIVDYCDGRRPSRADLNVALVRLLALTCDAMSLTTQVVAACDHDA